MRVGPGIGTLVNMVLIGVARLPLTTLREFTMLHIMNSITDKLGWEVKVCFYHVFPFY
jgi:hypothetical protein